MIESIKSLFSSKTAVDYNSLMDKGGLIIDVRTKGEFANGHIKNSVNVPGNELPNYLDKLEDKNQPIITCCASGIRSASAKNYLLKQGFKTVHNGGGWASLKKKLNN